MFELVWPMKHLLSSDRMKCNCNNDRAEAPIGDDGGQEEARIKKIRHSRKMLPNVPN